MKYVLGIVVMVLVVGCATVQPRPQSPEVITTTTQVLRQTIQSTDWLLSLLLVGCVLGVFAGLNGVKSGWFAVVACIWGIWLKAAISSEWVFWACGVLFVGSLVLAGVSVVLRHRVILDLILSCQQLKNEVQDDQRVSDIFKMAQSPDTKKVVNQTKAKLKNQGVL